MKPCGCVDEHPIRDPARDVMACGCWWERCPSFGDILVQCERHKAGAAYEGGEPMTAEETERFVGTLRAAGLDAREIGPKRGSA